MTPKPDDVTIRDEDPLWRRIHHALYVPDGRGGLRPSSAAFDNSNDGTGMSVTLGRESQAAGITPDLFLRAFPGFGLASLLARVCREHRQTLERDPTPSDPHHALVNGDKPKSVQRKLSAAATQLVAPSRP